MMNTGERHQRRKTPSFSSSLLDSIYRSIDESNGCDDIEDEEADMVLCRETATTRKKQGNVTSTSFKRNNAPEDNHVDEISSLRRAIMIEKWMENRSSHSSRSCRVLNSTTSSSSDSSCGGGVFSSSETESNYKDNSKSSVKQRPRQEVQTCFSARTEMMMNATPLFEPASKNRETGSSRFMMRTKSRALKMYGDLKKVKQPISPGGRISNFLNSLFNSRNLKNTEISETLVVEDLSSVRKSRSVTVKDSTTSTCSSASSFSRSCLVKTPSNSTSNSNSTSRGNNNLKRTVRFCPVSVIVDEDSRPCGEKSIYKIDPNLIAIPIGRKITESTTKLKNTLMEKYNNNNNNNNNARDYGEKSMNHVFVAFRDFDNDNDDDDDVEIESCSSSDLFELENIGAIGIGTYAEELPVYGTTNLKTNHAIAKGLIL